MMPDNALSSIFIRRPFLRPDNLDPSEGQDHEIGGIGISDPSQGLRVQVWHIRWIGNKVAIFSDTQPDRLLFQTDGIIRRASLAFDQNMRPTVAFTEKLFTGLRNRLYWYDPTINQHTFMALPEDALYPAVSLDDTNIEHTDISDILLAYINEVGELIVLRQRDRFLVPYTYDAGLPKDSYVEKVGMHAGNRFQFKVAVPIYAS